jgi:hypothetical protein
VAVNWTRAVAVLLLGLSVSCGNDSSADSGSTDGGSKGTYGASACGGCASAACASERQICLSEPSCAAYVSCLDACPTSPDGDVAADCEAACPGATGSTAEKALDDFRACRIYGPGAGCASCGAVDAGALPPLLTQQCTPSTNPKPCYACFDEHCCDSVQACVQVPACSATNDCATNCSPDDVPCHEACFQDESGVKPWLAFTACALHFCRADCGLQPDTCQSCVEQKCVNTQLACDTDPDCFLLGLCIAGCPDQTPACVAQCRAGASIPTLDLFDAFSLCRGYQCTIECGG